MSNKKLFYGLTALTVTAVGGYLVYRHVVPKALEAFRAAEGDRDYDQHPPHEPSLEGLDAWEEELLRQGYSRVDSNGPVDGTRVYTKNPEEGHTE